MPPPDYTSMPDAILGRLRSSPVASMAGDTYSMDAATGTVGIGFDYLPPGCALPYVVITEPGGSNSYFTYQTGGARPFLSYGSISLQAWAGDRETSRQLADLIGAALHDADLEWGGTNSTKLFRKVADNAVPTPPAGRDSPAVFLRIITFEYMFQGVA